MQNILFGFIAMVLGFFVTWKAYWITENFGRNEWAESHLGGGTVVMYKLIGIVIIFFGIFLITGLFGNIMKSIFGTIFGF